jgi:hypothetical protein
MKSYLRFFFFFAVLFSATVFTSCETDDPLDTNPDDARNAYVGVWRFNETGKLKSGKDITISYIVSISLDQDNSSQIILNNLGSSGQNFIGLVTSNQVVVTSQTINGITVEGSGENAGTGKMNWSYSITVGGDQTYYTAVATKQ